MDEKETEEALKHDAAVAIEQKQSVPAEQQEPHSYLLSGLIEPREVPYCCPVCLGSGLVQGGFYGSGVREAVLREQCRTCGGDGIVWG